MLSETNEIQRAYQKIRKQYNDVKQVIVAPCRCKMYVSRSSEIIDCEGKTSPNWFLFATGLATIVYDSASRELSLNLFDLHSARLSWMMRLTDDSHMYAPNSNFHVINTKSDCSEHVGLLYDSKDVAGMFLEKLSKLLVESACKSGENYENRPEMGTVPETLTDHKKMSSESRTREENRTTEESRPSYPRKKQNKFIRSLSMYFKRSSKHCGQADNGKVGANMSQADTIQHAKKLPKEELQQTHLENCQEESASGRSRSREKRRTRFSSRSKTLGAESFPKWPTLQKGQSSEGNERRRSQPDFIVDRVEDIFPSREQISSRSDTRQLHAPKCNLKSTGGNEMPENDASGTFNSSSKASIPGKRSTKKVNRSLSERRANTSGMDGPRVLKNEAVVRLRDAGARLERPRATSDTLLLKGNTITCMVETGHMAKYQRERKQWMAILEKGNVQTTDLCVTEL